MTDMSIVVPVYNRCDLTQVFLRTLWFVTGKGDEVIVVDNGSTDSTATVLELWKQHYGHRLRVLVNAQNEGFGRANNLGMQAAHGDIVVLMSNDVVVKAQFGSLVREALEADPKQLLCARLVDWKAGWNQFGATVIPYAEGWFLAFTRQFMADVGGFDDRFSPCDYEDVDLSYRAIQAGYTLRALPLPVQHIGGQTATQLGDRLAITNAHRAAFAEKWNLMP